MVGVVLVKDDIFRKLKPMWETLIAFATCLCTQSIMVWLRERPGEEYSCNIFTVVGGVSGAEKRNLENQSDCLYC